ncbi:MAG: hypothetical protein ACREO3_11105, partial [Arenimonas sp.]
IAMLPAGLVGGGVWLLGSLLDHAVAGLLAGGIAATAVLLAEVKLGVRTLGYRIDRFDLSQELR